jgi:D-alanyl-lipoteichoic acid acyltransferase DltB (MBOAT superfamily)
MLFNSVDFGLFLVAVLALYWTSPQNTRRWVLLGASYYFYSYTYPPYAFLLAFLTILNFHLARIMFESPKRAKICLTAGVTLDLLSIGFYKYVNLLLETINLAGFHLWMSPRLPLLDVILPIGISFYTFQLLSYLIEVYRGMQPEPSFRNFALYISFFPQLVAGPIVRPSVLLPQLRAGSRIDSERVQLGLFLVAQGLTKKVVFADFLGRHVDNVFANPGNFNSVSTLLAVYSYAFQIYFDFSGYTDIAIGCGKLLGFDIPDNFNLPYLSRNLREFWQRWHISLSTWLRDYLYISLGGSRIGPSRTHVNLMITMVLGGLWHGANWTFAIWGTFHGVLIAANHMRRRSTRFRQPENPSLARRILQVFITFHLVCAGWIFFRSETFSKAIDIFLKLGSLDWTGTIQGTDAAIMLAIASASHFMRGRINMERWFISMPGPVQGWAYACLTLLIYIFFTSEQRFIYFQF